MHRHTNDMWAIWKCLFGYRSKTCQFWHSIEGMINSSMRKNQTQWLFIEMRHIVDLCNYRMYNYIMARMTIKWVIHIWQLASQTIRILRYILPQLLVSLCFHLTPLPPSISPKTACDWYTNMKWIISRNVDFQRNKVNDKDKSRKWEIQLDKSRYLPNKIRRHIHKRRRKNSISYNATPNILTVRIPDKAIPRSYMIPKV